MENNEITKEDIEKVLKNTIILSYEYMLATIKDNKLPIVSPTILGNGYLVGSTIDDIGSTKIRHLSISNSKGETDPATADDIALKILGKGYQLIGEMHFKGVYHYMKPI